MSFLNKLFGSFSGGGTAGDPSLTLKIRCDHCKTEFGVRIDLVRDIIPTFEDTGPAYQLTKEAMDSKCFKMITIRMTFDNKKNMLSGEVDGGTIIEEADD